MTSALNKTATSVSLWPVRTFLNWLVLACLLPGVIGAAFLFMHQYREGRAQQEKDTIQTLRALVQVVDSHLLRVQTVAQALSTADSLANYDLALFHRRAREAVALAELGSNVVLRDSAGRQLINTAVEFGRPLPSQVVPDQVRAVFTTGKPTVSEVFIGPLFKRPIMSVDVPVILDGKVAYALGVDMLPEHFNAILNAQSLPSGWVAAIFDSTGTIAGRNQFPEKFVGNKAGANLLESMMKSPEGSIEATTQEGTPVLSFYSRSPVTHWRVVIGIPRQALEGALVRRFSMLAAGMAALFGIGLLLAWFMGEKIAHSVKALIAPAMALGGGASAPAAGVHIHIKEAAEVASAISRASDLLKERAATLEVREMELAEAHRLAGFGTWHWNLKTGEVEVSDSICEIYGRAVPSFAAQRGTLLTVESWERVNAASQEVIQTCKGYDLELQVNHGRGDTIWINSKCEAVCNEKGEVLALRGTIQDITERKGQEEALRRSEFHALEAARRAEAERRRLNAVLEATPVGIIVADANGAALESNAANRQLWGVSDAESLHACRQWKGWWADGSEKHGEPLEPHEWAMARALNGQEAPRDIVEIETFDAPPVRRIVLVSGASIKDGEGKIIGGVVAQMDITDRVVAEEALRHADRRKDEFLAMLAHELRNPLAPISAAADLLGLDRLDEARVKQTSAIIARQVKHMTGLVDDLLDVSRVRYGLVRLEKQKLDAKRLVSDAIEQVRPLMEAKRQRLAIHTSHEPAFVLGDQKRLVQVVANLLNNGSKFTPEGGDLVLKVEVDGGDVKITVADNGIGMTPDMAKRAFKLFAQGERTPDRSQGGLGIGLALVKSLVELHDGNASAQSDGTGKGSRFTVRLPHLKGQSGLSGTAQSAATAPASLDVLKVMIVDDNEDAAEMLAMFVETLGHRVFIEHGSKKAFEHAILEMPDVCLLDIGLPEMDGNELARRLRARPETRKAILVAVTGYGQEQDRDHALEAGFDHYFVKPLDTVKLASMLIEINCSHRDLL